MTNAGPEPPPARAADRLVPQHLGLGDRRAAARPGGDGRQRRSAIQHPFARRPRAARRDRTGRRGAGTAFLRERDQHRTCSASAGHAVPEGRDRGSRDPRSGDRQPRSNRHQVRRLVPGRLSAGQSAELRLRLRPATRTAAGRQRPADALGADFDRVMAQRQGRGRRVLRRADPGRRERRRGDDHAPGVRRDAVVQAAVLLRRRPLAGRRPDSAAAADAAADRTQLPLAQFRAFDIMSMPDKWEYPWFAAWDLAFHCVALAHVDPAFAKYQLILLCREWFQHPSGALPAYEWDFGDVNPPVQAWAALEVFAVDGGHDIDFLSRVFDKLLLNFTWWVNREDAEGNNLFEGGFLGLDNIGPIDRSHLPVGGLLEQSDATGWMGFYAMAMASIALVLHRSGQRPGTDLMMKFLEHFAAIRDALDGLGLWDETDGIYYDRLITPSGDRAGQGPLGGRHDPRARRRGHHRGDLERALAVGKRFAGFLARHDLRRPGQAQRRRRAARRARPSAAAAQLRRAGQAGPAARQGCSTRASSCPRTACAPCRPGTGSIPTRSNTTAPGVHRLRAGRVHHADVRRELELARAGLVPGELPGDQRPRAIPQVLRRRPDDRVPDRLRPPASLDRSRPTWRPADLDLRPRRRTAGGPASAGPSCCSPIPHGATT